ncbi:E3 ubiquitin-protein ligase PHF7-like [Strix aluco]|uniref:E3 ubiquitin-protein ligase PHF7-like n=1 Tax=Strix aluco TaxID=111821 RepID=UPI003DA27F3E
MYAMSEREEEEAPNLMEQVCVLCGRAEADLDLWVKKIEREEFCVHLFCLLFASKIFYWQDEESGLQAVLPEDIRRTVVRAAQKKCFICGESGAAITCCWEGCDRSFHLPCAMEGECVTQYFPPHSSFCREHRPEQEVEAAPENNTECLICLEPVEDRKSYHTMVCPACKHAWFHRGCIQVGAVPSTPGQAALGTRRHPSLLLLFPLQGQARYAGTTTFSCPLCRDKQDFLMDMLTMGIRIPLSPGPLLSHQSPGFSFTKELYTGQGGGAGLPCISLMQRQQGLNDFPFSIRNPSRDNGPPDEALIQRHSRCDARECLCPRGREQAEERGPWELLLCSSCAAEGTHRRCSNLRTSRTSWECESCAGQGTASSDRSELAGSGTGSRSGSGPSHDSTAPESSSSSTGSQVASGPSHDSPVPAGSSSSSSPGPDRRQRRSQVQPSVEADAGPAVRRPHVLALIPLHRRNKVGR